MDPTRLRASAVRLANMRQGRSSTPRCEPPSEYAIQHAFEDIRDALAVLPDDIFATYKEIK